MARTHIRWRMKGISYYCAVKCFETPYDKSHQYTKNSFYSAKLNLQFSQVAPKIRLLFVGAFVENLNQKWNKSKSHFSMNFPDIRDANANGTSYFEQFASSSFLAVFFLNLSFYSTCRQFDRFKYCMYYFSYARTAIWNWQYGLLIEFYGFASIFFFRKFSWWKFNIDCIL